MDDVESDVALLLWKLIYEHKFSPNYEIVWKQAFPKTSVFSVSDMHLFPV